MKQWLPALLLLLTVGSARAQVYLTDGMKIAEVTDRSALIWTRICGVEKPNPVVHDRSDNPIRRPLDFDDSMPVAEMDSAVAGAAGQARVVLTPAGGASVASDWKEASAEDDFTLRFLFEDLTPYTEYSVRLEARPARGRVPCVLTGRLRTAPRPDQVAPVLCTSISCQQFWDYDDPRRGFIVYDSMRKLGPDFLVHTGDYVYYDKAGPVATTPAKACYKWHRMNAWPALVDFYRTVPSYLTKDDHDTLRDDCYPGIKPLGELTFSEAVKIWYEQAPVRDKPYRTFRWGRDLQIWIVEGREFRTPNPTPDGPEKSIWGATQKQWFIDTVTQSDATFKILFSPTPVVGPDRDRKADNHANRTYAHEGRWLRRFLAGQGNSFVVNGDRHWQYVSVDEETGLREYSQGPASDSHAQGWRPDDRRAEHRFLRVAGGFVAARVWREDGQPQIEFTHYDVQGRVVHTDRPPLTRR